VTEKLNLQQSMIWVIAALGILFGAIFNFLPMTPLWLDEAQSASIAGESFSSLVEALRHDGHPPLYYFLLGVWADLFGNSDFALRAFSGSLGCAVIIMTWFTCRIHMGKKESVIAASLIAASPFSIRYATEVRMYSLLIFLLLCVYLNFYRVTQRPNNKNRFLYALTLACMLLTHYWSLFFVLVVILSLLVKAKRTTGEERKEFKSLIAWSAGACIPFAFWLPIFFEQLQHTGTPWARAPRPTVVLALTLEAFGGGKGSEALLVAVALSLLVAVGFFTRFNEKATGLEVGVNELPWLKRMCLISVCTMLLGSSVSLLTDTAFQGRYGVFFFPFVIFASAVGLSRLPTKVSLLLLTLFLLLCSVSVARELTRDRTQLGEITEVVASEGKEGDSIVFCPDQLAPAGNRTLGESYEFFAYPSLERGERVDWYDYRERNLDASPSLLVEELLAKSTSRQNIWLVWIDGFESFGNQCSLFRSELNKRLDGGETLVNADGEEYYNPANLVRYDSKK
jgi:4-amino-4-deoxy-L-arabinose transferase-like glycosyltransferase